MAIILIESTVATRGETTTSYSNRCCTKARAAELNCTVIEPSNASNSQLITKVKGNMPNLAVSMSGWTYGGTAKSPSVTGNTGGGEVTYTYKASGSSSYSSTKPTNVGTHTVKASVAATTNYIAKEVTTTYTVDKATRSGSVSCDNVTYGSTVTATVSGNTENGTITWGITPGTGTATINSSGVVTPTKAGKVTVTATVAATNNYKSYTATSKQITISQRTVTITAPTKSNKTYTGSSQTIFVKGSCTDGGVMYYSDTNKAFSTSTWSTSLPYSKKTAVGTYTLYYYCYVSDTTNNKGTGINTISSISATISKANTNAPILTAGGSNIYTGITYYAKAANGDGNPAGKIYYGASSGATTYSITASSTATNLSKMGRTNVGTTTIYAFFRPTDTDNYNDSSSVSTTVKISGKADISPTVTMAGWTYGGTPSNPSVSGNTGNGTVTYKYKVSTAQDSTYTTTKPSDAGTYTVRAEIAETTNYNGATITTNFTIAKATPILTWTANPNEVFVDNNINVSATSSTGTITYSTSDTSIATIFGEVVNQHTQEVTEVIIKGKSIGECTISASVAETTNYKGKTISYTLYVKIPIQIKINSGGLSNLGTYAKHIKLEWDSGIALTSWKTLFEEDINVKIDSSSYTTMGISKDTKGYISGNMTWKITIIDSNNNTYYAIRNQGYFWQERETILTLTNSEYLNSI